MSSYYTSDNLIKSVKRRAMIPQSQSTFATEDFLAFADEEMNLGLVPSVLRQHEDYYLYTEQITLTAGKVRYSIPYRAIGNKLRDVAFEDANGDVYEMTRISIEDVPFYNQNNSTGRVYAYYIENNDVVLVPDSVSIAADTKLRMSYYLRPNSLVLLSDVAVITNINRVTGAITVSSVPTGFSATQLLDLVKVKSPHKILDFDIQPVSINSSTKTITLSLSDIPEDLEAGDHITLAEQTAIPQLPSDLHVVLAHRVAARCLEALGDTEGLQSANQKLAELEQQTATLIDNRVEGAPRKVIARHTALRNGLYSRRR